MTEWKAARRAGRLLPEVACLVAAFALVFRWALGRENETMYVAITMALYFWVAMRSKGVRL
jgi:hypothetical protein